MSGNVFNVNINGDGKPAGWDGETPPWFMPVSVGENVVSGQYMDHNPEGMGGRRAVKLDKKGDEVELVPATISGRAFGALAGEGKVDLSDWEMVSEETGGVCSNKAPPRPPKISEFFRDLFGLGEQGDFMKKI